MEITSLNVVFISLAAIFVYYELNQQLRVLFLVALSGAFIASYSFNLLAYVTGYALVVYGTGLWMGKSRFRKAIFISGLVFNLLQLILLKYVSFTFDPLFRLLNVGIDLSLIARYIVPIGVSFFTLQGIGYLVNLNMGWEQPEKNFFHFLLYLIFYPRFLSGPIDRSNSFLPQLKVRQAFEMKNIISGLRLLLLGLFKKVVIANQLALWVHGSYEQMDSLDKFSWLLVVLVQPIYIYYDFAGYTDIAFGLARTFGLELRPNFNRPFLAENVSNFWKRFHISLASWFNDYVFTRTMFKVRKWGKNATTFALLVTWLLFGIWHGAGWNFMLLGLLQALAIYYEFRTRKWRSHWFGKLPGFLRVWSGRAFTYLFYSVSLVFFFSPDLHTTGQIFSRLFDLQGLLPYGVNAPNLLFVLCLALLFLCFEVLENDFNDSFRKLETFWFGSGIGRQAIRWAYYYILIFMVLAYNFNIQEFIYFQF